MTKKIGLMGCGQVATYGHIPAILDAEGLELHAVYDPSEENLKKVAEKFGISRSYSSLDDFFGSGIEAVTITSPAPFHRDNVLDCAKYGFPVLCEKPLAMTRSEGEGMVEAMSSRGLSFYCGFCYRFSPVALKIRELVTENAIGSVKSLRLIYNWHLHGKYEIDPSGTRILQKRREGRMEEGGPMVDCGTHQIELAHFWTGSPVVRSVAHGAWVDDYEAPDHMWLHLDHASGAHSVVEISYSYSHTSLNQRSDFVYELIGSGGIIHYERDAKVFFLENEQGRTDLDWSHEKAFEGMYEEWAKALHSGHSELLTTASEGVRVADLAREATDAAIRDRLPVA
ncbi:Gfo/Idh/MocA family protein [Puniceicoccus vermicola]|uniref:Gfo/Idh/MocA family oxidoreductase n=1 Tax=Puniceicoccus vermicola TaxID=388746 RepID=A0A7X1B1A7_9BACT|nr:Gfo/Idh/MocA family oxidoreductase [Puniceicoccus vermicola]MBC2603779.1 Gfo/Idh/MocA family oxidoreductase [Puniceicoccus vermicola]